MSNNAFARCRRLIKISVLVTSLTAALMLFSCKQPDREIPNHREQVDSIIDNTNDLLNVGLVQKSLRYLDSSYRQIQSPGPVDQWRKYDHKVNFYLNYEFNLRKARLNADSMVFVLKHNVPKYQTEYASAIFAKGHVLLAEKRYAEAFKHYYDGRAFARQHLDNCSYYRFTYRLGMVRYGQRLYLKAIPYFKQALRENEGCREIDGFDERFSFQQSSLTAIALAYELSNMTDSAVYYYHLGLDFVDRNVHKYPERKDFVATVRGVIYGNLGGAYAKRGQDKEAEYYLKQSILINGSPGHDLQDAQTAKLKLAELYIGLARFKEAKELLDQLEVYLGKKRNNPTNEGLRVRWYKLKWMYFNQTGQYLQAYQYLQQYHTSQDSLNSVNAGLKEIDMDAIFKDNQQQYKLALLNKDNEVKTGYLAASILFSVMAVGILAGVLYILRRSRKLYNQLAQKNEELQMTLGSLEQSQQENTRIMKVVAHDLRSPMAATVSIAMLLLENKHLAPDDKEMLELMKTSSLHSLEMIADLLNMNTRADELKKEPVEMQTLLRSCVDLLKFKANEKKQEILLQAKHLVIDVNREKIWRVVSNLIVNAIKFSPEGSIIHVGIEQWQDVVQISIRDHGIGIPEKLKNKIFNIFTDAKRKGTSGEQSFGLGLAISKQIVEAHGGKIWFESNDDQGTTFFVELPIPNNYII